MRVPSRDRVSVAGFSLAETVVGMGVVGVLIVSLYAALTSGVSTVQMAREDQRATQVLVRAMDQVRLLSWDQILDSTAVPSTFTSYFDPEDDDVHTTSRGRGRGRGRGNKSLVFTATLTIADP